jgi:hypothetical protein
LDEASFCRSCGADVSLVPQALTGRLPEATVTKVEAGRGRGRKETKIEDAVSTMFVGLAFLLIVVGGAMFFRGGFMMWIWMLIPGFACLGSGVGKYMQYKHEREAAMLPSATTRPAPLFTSNTAHNPNVLPARDTAEIVASFDRAPSSVTENTTRLLDADAAPRRKARLSRADE